MKPGARDLGDFLDKEVLPSLFDRLDFAFPEFGWKRDRDGWVATNRDHTKATTGARPDRVVCHKPFGFLVHGGEATSWTCYVNGGTKPTGKPFVEAVRKLAELAQVPFPEKEWTKAEVKRAEERDRRKALLEAFLALTQEALRGDEGKDARAYLAGRGLKDEAVEGLGLFTTGERVRSTLTSKGFTADELEALGVFREGWWDGRLVIPWRDRWGHLGTFTARDLTGKEEKARKYLYMSGAKRAELVAFGLDRALKKGADRLVLMEGLLDVVNLQSLGFSSVAAIGGNGREMTPERWEALAAFGVKAVILALDDGKPEEDGPHQGLAGTVAAVDNVLKVRNVRNVPVVYVLHPAALGGLKDPDAFIHENGVDAFRALFDTLEPAALFMGRHLLGDVTPSSTAREKLKATGKLFAFADSLKDTLSSFEKEGLVALISERTGYAPATIATFMKFHEDQFVAKTERGVINKIKSFIGGQNGPGFWGVFGGLLAWGVMVGMSYNVFVGDAYGMGDYQPSKIFCRMLVFIFPTIATFIYLRFIKKDFYECSETNKLWVILRRAVIVLLGYVFSMVGLIFIMAVLSALFRGIAKSSIWRITGEFWVFIVAIILVAAYRGADAYLKENRAKSIEKREMYRDTQVKVTLIGNYAGQILLGIRVWKKSMPGAEPPELRPEIFMSEYSRGGSAITIWPDAIRPLIAALEEAERTINAG